MLARPRDRFHVPPLQLLPSRLPSGRTPDVLRDPTPDELRRALEGNQRQWLLRLARYGGELVRRDGGVLWHDAPDAGGEIQVPFPRFDRGRIDAQLDALLAALRGPAAPRPVRLWTSAPARPEDLPIRLLARGFRPGARPRWLRLDLWRLRDVRWGPNGLRIAPEPEPALWDDFPHPYHGGGPAARTAIAATLRVVRALPEQVTHVVAWLDGRPVGAATLHLTGGPRGIAAIYDLGVLPAYRNRGIGTALATEVLKAAWGRGCAIAGLCATPLAEPVARRLGFEPAGEVQTWELLAAEPPVPALVAFAEAIGRGDTAALDNLATTLAEGAIARPLACGMTPLRLAAWCRQPAAAEWVVARGAPLDVLTAWDLGWTERAVRLLAEQPWQADARGDASGATPLHAAAQRGDVELASLLLAAGADPAIPDSTFNATPRAWADHFGHAEIADLLASAGG